MGKFKASRAPGRESTHGNRAFLFIITVIFHYLTGRSHVAQAGLKLTTLTPILLASFLSAAVIGMHHPCRQKETEGDVRKEKKRGGA